MNLKESNAFHIFALKSSRNFFHAKTKQKQFYFAFFRHRFLFFSLFLFVFLFANTLFSFSFLGLIDNGLSWLISSRSWTMTGHRRHHYFSTENKTTIITSMLHLFLFVFFFLFFFSVLWLTDMTNALAHTRSVRAYSSHTLPRSRFFSILSINFIGSNVLIKCPYMAI